MPGRTTITLVATKVDIDRATASQEIHDITAEAPYDLHLHGETIFTKYGYLTELLSSLTTQGGDRLNRQ